MDNATKYCEYWFAEGSQKDRVNRRVILGGDVHAGRSAPAPRVLVRRAAVGEPRGAGQLLEGLADCARQECPHADAAPLGKIVTSVFPPALAASLTKHWLQGDKDERNPLWENLYVCCDFEVSAVRLV